jgi:hypothetical protein
MPNQPHAEKHRIRQVETEHPSALHVFLPLCAGDFSIANMIIYFPPWKEIMEI